MAIYHHTTRMIGCSNAGSPVKALAYISGTQLSDERTGEIFDFKDKSVEEVRILLPENAPEWAKKIQKLVSNDKDPNDCGPKNQELSNRDKGLQRLSDMVNSAEKRGDAQVYREIEFSLPRELTYEQNRQLAEEYVQDQFCGIGMLAIQSFHIEICEKTGELNPHCHTLFLTRELTEDGLSLKKNRDWNERSVHEVWREQWAQYASFHLKMHGHDITLDHRSYEDQGLDIEPQVKLGKGVKEQEKRAKTKDSFGEKKPDPGTKQNQDPDLCSMEDSNAKANPTQGKGFVDSVPTTGRVQELRSIQLRNLYRIMRRPETVLDIVTRHHATFMWGDVQKILGRYVDEPELFQRLDVRLKNSSELLLLKMDGVRDRSGRIEERAIYTTRSMLKAEKSLVDIAEALAAHHIHGVSFGAQDAGLERIQGTLQKEGYSLSEDQTRAIRHLVDEGQLKCIVGYAGAGKTTALEACRNIWEREGFRVYGLAPTGRAAQNLEGGGISSMTLHKFLKSFEEGRCQYGEKSVLVLDEAGMVDVERFGKFLGAVRSLGVKAVVVGDGAQLQPVEAGPAFRLVTERVGVSRLEKVVRQKEEWQKEATVLFGKQESKTAIQAYQSKGHVHLIEEPINGTLGKGKLNKEAVFDGIPYQKSNLEDVLRRYEVSARTSGLIFREIMKEVTQNNEKNSSQGVSQHQDYLQFLKWKGIQKEAAHEILGRADDYRGALEERGLDPLEMARLFVDKKQDKASQYEQATELLKGKGLDHLIGVERTPGHSVEVRSAAKAALMEDWKKAYRDDPSQSLLMMAYSNRDVRDLNSQARSLLKKSGDLGREDMTYSITREVEDDFGRRAKFKETREFSKGDRIVFTRNKMDLGVKNGSMGTIVSLDKNSIEVALDAKSLDKSSIDKGETLTFSPNIFSFFDQGWAVTIHKSQGTTVDKSFLLASHEMNQNLTYVAMTRHREDVHVYGSTLDFWREKKVADVLSKSGEKLGAADYLDAQSLRLLMKDEDRFLNRLFTRLSDELHAMGAVSKRAFGIVADHFLGRSFKDMSSDDTQASLKSPILLRPEVIREEDRSHDILQKPQHIKSYTEKEDTLGGNHIDDPLGILNQKLARINLTLQDVYEDWKHPAFKEAEFFKCVFKEGLKVHGESASIQYWNQKREPYKQTFEQKMEKLEKELQSPLLSYMSNESRELARKVALENPDKALAFLDQVKSSKQAELATRGKAIQPPSPSFKPKEPLIPSSQVNTSLKDENATIKKDIEEAMSSYFRFRELKIELEQSPHNSDYKNEMREIGKKLVKNKEMFSRIESIDPEMSKLIKRVALEEIRAREKQLEHDHGGFSL